MYFLGLITMNRKSLSGNECLDGDKAVFGVQCLSDLLRKRLNMAPFKMWKPAPGRPSGEVKATEAVQKPAFKAVG